MPGFQPEFGNVPQWFSAIGTVGALFLALFQINRERGYRQATKERELQEGRLAQARLISAVVGNQEMIEPGVRGRTAVRLINGSDEPVYRLVVGIVFIQGAAPHALEDWLKPEVTPAVKGGVVTPSTMTTVSILPSGQWQVWIHEAAFGVMMGRIGAEVAFTDRAGRHWVRRATGALEELGVEPFEHFNLCGPYELQIPERIGEAGHE